MMVSADPVQPTFVEAIPAFADNYIWALRRGDRIAVVDPGDALAVERYLDRRNGQLVAILITHHHGDHTGGVSDLVAGRDIPVFGPALSRIAHVNRPLRGGERLVLDALGLAFDVWHVPGHTLDHLAYVGEDDLFCGDTLFAAGCGRLFEGTGAQMFDSLSRLASLPDRTRVFCAHEYTLANLRFARVVEPDNAETAARVADAEARRGRGEPTLPTRLGHERATNPFLRCDRPEVQERLRALRGVPVHSPLEAFIALRQWKDEFR